ncbi:hypothetical protein BASA50_001896 [Batrachochytrium salamandrivorans]|uniref:Protein kinase domain-containing protein n=1 Tax=Batrachochytrium salamandrivorans TaxID=1357716 RepID=A0ABQ8FMT0_9FUNG|nr:hypothetical protein BASA50_001896 [Batrachochytrium salamandrivorans]
MESQVSGPDAADHRADIVHGSREKSNSQSSSHNDHAGRHGRNDQKQELDPSSSLHSLGSDSRPSKRSIDSDSDADEDSPLSHSREPSVEDMVMDTHADRPSIASTSADGPSIDNSLLLPPHRKRPNLEQRPCAPNDEQQLVFEDSLVDPLSGPCSPLRSSSDRDEHGQAVALSGQLGESQTYADISARHNNIASSRTSVLTNSGSGSPRSMHAVSIHNDDDYESDNEPLPPAPQAPRHPTLEPGESIDLMLSATTSPDNGHATTTTNSTPPVAISDDVDPAINSTLLTAPPTIATGDVANKSRPHSGGDAEDGELHDETHRSLCLTNNSDFQSSALLLSGVASHPLHRSHSDMSLASGTSNVIVSSSSVASTTAIASTKIDPENASTTSGHPSRPISNIRYSNSSEGNQFVPNSPYSIGAEGSLKSPDVRSQSSRDRRHDIVRFCGCSSHTEYEFQKKIGEGTFGEVTIGQHKVSKDVVALKKILVHNEREGIPITALREIKILKALSHENVISLREMAYKSGDRGKRERGTIYMVFPYMDHDLTGLLENPQVRFTPAQIKSYMRQLLLGIEYMHKNNILHRDMKGSNILVDNYGHLKIADFGLARAYIENENKGYTNMVVTRWYRPPELLMGATNYTTSIDIWGAGCVFGEMLKRRPILAGSDDMDQLEKIFILCGTPDETVWPGYRNLPIFNPKTGTIQSFRNEHKRIIHEKFPSNHFARDTVDLLDNFLMLDPSKRPSASKALEHDYFFVPPKAAVPGTPDFIPWPTSHELDSRLAKEEAAVNARALEGTGVRPQVTHLQNHFDAQLVNELINRRQPGVGPDYDHHNGGARLGTSYNNSSNNSTGNSVHGGSHGAGRQGKFNKPAVLYPSVSAQFQNKVPPPQPQSQSLPAIPSQPPPPQLSQPHPPPPPPHFTPLPGQPMPIPPPQGTLGMPFNVPRSGHNLVSPAPWISGSGHIPPQPSHSLPPPSQSLHTQQFNHSGNPGWSGGAGIADSGSVGASSSSSGYPNNGRGASGPNVGGLSNSSSNYDGSQSSSYRSQYGSNRRFGKDDHRHDTNRNRSGGNYNGPREAPRRDERRR